MNCGSADWSGYTTMNNGADSSSECICESGFFRHDASCTRCPVSTSSSSLNSTSSSDCSACDSESSRDDINGNCGVHLCQQIVVRGDESSPDYGDLPNVDIFGRIYSITSEVYGGSPVYMTFDSVFNIRYYGPDNAWKLQNSTGTTFVTVNNAKESPHGSPEKDYRCSFSGDEERWCGDIVSINCVDFEVDTTLLPHSPTNMFVATQEERVLATDHNLDSYKTFVDYDGSYKGDSEQIQMLFLSSLEFLVTDRDRDSILRYDVSGELLNINRNVTNPTAMLDIGDGEVLVLSGKSESHASSLVIMSTTDGDFLSEEVELSTGASSDEIEATSMCLGRGERDI